MNAIERFKVDDVPIPFNLTSANDVDQGRVGVQKAAVLEDKVNISCCDPPLSHSIPSMIRQREKVGAGLN